MTRRLRSADHEGVAGTAGAAAGDRRGDGVALDQQRSRQVQDQHQQDGAPDEHPIDAAVEPAGREGQQEVDQQRLERPLRDPPDAVERRVLGVGQRREEPDGARGDQQRAEALERRPTQREEADGDRRGHREHAHERLEPRVVRRGPRRGERRP